MTKAFEVEVPSGENYNKINRTKVIYLHSRNINLHVNSLNSTHVGVT